MIIVYLTLLDTKHFALEYLVKKSNMVIQYKFAY